MPAMLPIQPVTRRLLLRRFAQASPVCATFLLPPAHAVQAARLARHGHAGAKGGLPVPPMPPERVLTPRSPAPIVMLDPGHGGRDPGAVGVSGTYEKSVALDTALQLKTLLEAGGRYRVVLTRSKDVFIPLEERVARAQEQGAALFLSMHADALADHAVRGASVYTLGETASDPQTAALARRENAADLHGRISRTGPVEVQQVIANLMRQQTLDGSAKVAQSLVGSLDRDLPMLPNPERHAGFVVLQSASIPSVLVEMGFMSNRRDEAALRTVAHRMKVAQAMRRAVDLYFSGGDRLV
jgi:N-acetylmuramoyl-L-alanine amidase